MRWFKEEDFDVIHKGWAPLCVHGPEDEAPAVAWLEETRLMIEANGEIVAPASPYPPHVGGFLETLMWAIDWEFGPEIERGLVKSGVGHACDQWVVVWASGKIGETRVHTDYEADTFLLAFAATYRWWDQKKKELARNG